MAEGPIIERMDAALATLTERWTGRRKPKAFYLGRVDWAEFEILHDGQTVTLPFGNNPVRERTDPVHRGVPVRPSNGNADFWSRLYDHCGYGHSLPPLLGQPRPPRKAPPIPAEAVFEALDRLSRTRALTEAESVALEQAMKGKVVISRREAIRLGVKP